MPWGMSIDGFILLLVIVIATLFVLNLAKPQFDIATYIQGTQLQPILPAFQWLQDQSTKNYTLPAGAIALIVLFGALLLPKK